MRSDTPRHPTPPGRVARRFPPIGADYGFVIFLLTPCRSQHYPAAPEGQMQDLA
jgi:hypothetical protein